LLDDEDNKGELVFCATYDPLLSFYFPLNCLDEDIITQLKSKFILTEEQNTLRINMLKDLPISEEFIHSILAMHVIESNVVDYRDGKIDSLVRFNNMPLREFVSAPGYENIFFVVDLDISDLSLICVEVHPNKPLVYNRAKLCVKQVSLAHWQGPVYPLENYDEIFSIADEHMFYKKIQEIESRDESETQDEK
jgi:hypothetical protein